MTDDRTIIQEEGDKLAAAEYVLGVLGAAERRQAQQRLAHDQAFADEVAFWEERLGSFADAVAPVAPPARAWTRIARAVKVRDPAMARESLWQSLTFWRSFALGAAALAVASIGALTFIEISPVARPPMLATLGASNGQPTFVAAVNAGGTGLLVVPAALLTADPRAMELWLIPAGDKPHSLGLIEPGRPVHLDVPRELAGRLTADAALAVTMEPPGGSPTGQPTGPIVASGKLTSL
ncbi:MAG TPA: anti-sigma factor [Xanthobacteraceae bacterium]|nr:anti-sigma factor [Xanthobacteraceae bacterium]